MTFLALLSFPSSGQLEDYTPRLQVLAVASSHTSRGGDRASGRGEWERSLPALFMAGHGELAGKFPVGKQCFMLILKETENISSSEILIFLCASKKMWKLWLSAFS